MQYSVGAVLCTTKPSLAEDDGDFIDCVGHKPMGLISTSWGVAVFSTFAKWT